MTPPPPKTIDVAIQGPVVRSDLPGLCARVRDLLCDSGADVVLCDLRSVAADAVAVDALARLQLTASRLGCNVRLRAVPCNLRQLLDFAGLSGVLGLEVRRQAEEWEDPGRVEEEGELYDPAG